MAAGCDRGTKQTPLHTRPILLRLRIPLFVRENIRLLGLISPLCHSHVPSCICNQQFCRSCRFERLSCFLLETRDEAIAAVSYFKMLFELVELWLKWHQIAAVIYAKGGLGHEGSGRVRSVWLRRVGLSSVTSAEQYVCAIMVNSEPLKPMAG